MIVILFLRVFAVFFWILLLTIINAGMLFEIESGDFDLGVFLRLLTVHVCSTLTTCDEAASMISVGLHLKRQNYLIHISIVVKITSEIDTTSTWKVFVCDNVSSTL